jgi:hypothetical protein
MSEYYKTRLHVKKTSWLVINLDYILKNYYLEFKNTFLHNKHNINNFEWTKYEMNDVDFDGDKFPLEITNDLIKEIKQKILLLIEYNKITVNNHVILIHEQPYTLDTQNQNQTQTQTPIQNWRNEVYSDFNYKDSNHLFKSIDKLLENSSELVTFFRESNFIYITERNIPVNDMIAIITKNIEKSYNYNNIIIISDSYDIYQLVSDKIHILNIHCEEDVTRILSSGEVNLWYHIINGHKKNGIPALLFKTNMIYDFIKETNNYHPINKPESIEFRELNKRELYYVLHHLNDFKKFIENTPEFVLNKQHIINRQIIDFNNIPTNIIETINKIFIEMSKKISYQSDNPHNLHNLHNPHNPHIHHIPDNHHNEIKKLKPSNNHPKLLKKSNNIFSALTIYDSDNLDDSSDNLNNSNN